MTFTFGSVCSGIEAASVAWHPLGWKTAWVSEIDPFASAVLAHRYPEVKNFGDFTTIPASAGPIDLLVGGTPCQSFSVAGLRGGLADDRGNLALEYFRLAARLRPTWLVWENVPGVLSSNGGRDFGAILGAMVELGYGFAYRVLDAQFFGVPQRRRRVFLVGHLGDWRRAASVLFEPESLRRDPRSGGKKGKEAAREAADGAGGGVGVECFNAEGAEGVPFLPASNIGRHVNNQTPILTFHLTQDPISSDQHTPALGATEACLGVIDSRHAVRRLTPRECERLQGFSDDWTLVPWRKGFSPDGPRYRALGNSMAVPVMRWIGERIATVDAEAK